MRLFRVSRWSSFWCDQAVPYKNLNISFATYIMPANWHGTREPTRRFFPCDSRRSRALRGPPAQDWFARGGDFVETADAWGGWGGLHEIRRGIGFGGDGAHRVNK